MNRIYLGFGDVLQRVMDFTFDQLDLDEKKFIVEFLHLLNKIVDDLQSSL